MSQPTEAPEGRSAGALHRSFDVTNERPSLCAPCGECCRTRPGAEDPERFLRAPDPAGALGAAIASGDWVLARLAGVRYARPATVRERASGTVDAGAEGSPCVFLDPGGCRLAFAARPRMCRDLEPWANGECASSWDLADAVRAWAACPGLVEEALRAARDGKGQASGAGLPLVPSPRDPR